MVRKIQREIRIREILRVILVLSRSFNYLVKPPLFMRLAFVSPARILLLQKSCVLQQASVLLAGPSSFSLVALFPAPHQSVPNVYHIISMNKEKTTAKESPIINNKTINLFSFVTSTCTFYYADFASVEINVSCRWNKAANEII